MHEYYTFLDEQINTAVDVDIGFTMLVASRAYEPDPEEARGFVDRYEIIKEYQQALLDLFFESLAGEAHPLAARALLGDLPEPLGRAYHLELPREWARTPLFFRTDEASPGKILEIQCPGSMWGLYEQVRGLYLSGIGSFDTLGRFERGLDERFVADLESVAGKGAGVAHLVDNVSVPHGMRYFVQQTRRKGARYLGRDKGVDAENCSLVRSHDFISLTANNFSSLWLSRWRDGDLLYDLPPMIIFEVKTGMALPFLPETREYFSDRTRSLFPHTCLVTPKGVIMADGERLSLDDFCDLPRSRRDYFLKYAGSDVGINWGGKAVYSMGNSSRVTLRRLIGEAAAGYEQNRYWVLQQGVQTKREARWVTRDGQEVESSAYAKYSGFYGPGGLLGLMLLERPFYKVHGATDAVVSIGAVR